ncbi:protein ORF115 [Anguillid herpesvirus 1]|uniref:Protein ORF115 n=1 Tax=Anguillid herpesvirus 1 TaxID=150286 RepID=A0A1J0REE4_9VIRU|nr:protein ORF115 [Anguillid herpesvirus 1]ADA57878.1 protein ORF115 [Anguillid herpesvirus 1]APD76279.1 ORF115 [Anguillid herpesvirus 1]QRM16409.1 protein ORF115 [Anguillid herpesvirus 1]QRM16668.1 protein ORF115 [Anguillid herpesvirus 1]UWI83689.1 protein ORF115 [Anguillid herpesvirus 1]
MATNHTMTGCVFDCLQTPPLLVTRCVNDCLGFNWFFVAAALIGAFVTFVGFMLVLGACAIHNRRRRRRIRTRLINSTSELEATTNLLNSGKLELNRIDDDDDDDI